MFEIGKGIEMPQYYGKKYPFGEMEVGDSFLVTNIREVRSLTGIVCYANKRLKRKFITRNVDNGVRVWRIE